jgi:hypothetical protein
MNNTIKLGGLLDRLAPADTYPILNPDTQLGGFREKASLAEMYAIPLEQRSIGMLVGVTDQIVNGTTGTRYFRLTAEGITRYDNTDWVDILSGVTSFFVKNIIKNEVLIVPSRCMYVVYGDLTVDTNGVLENYGTIVIFDGDIVLLNNGVNSNLTGGGTTGIVILKNLASSSKYSETFTLSSSTFDYTVTHNLGTTDITYSLRQGNNMITANVEIIDANSIKVSAADLITDPIRIVIKA